MTTKKFLLVIAIACIVFSCKKPAIETDPNFIGRWDDGIGGFYPHSINIDSDGTGSFSRGFDNEENYEHWQGKVKANKTCLKIGSSPNFEIVQFPTQIDSMRFYNEIVTWEIVLAYPKTIGYDGLEFTLYKK